MNNARARGRAARHDRGHECASRMKHANERRRKRLKRHPERRIDGPSRCRAHRKPLERFASRVGGPMRRTGGDRERLSIEVVQRHARECGAVCVDRVRIFTRSRHKHRRDDVAVQPLHCTALAASDPGSTRVLSSGAGTTVPAPVVRSKTRPVAPSCATSCASIDAPSDIRILRDGWPSRADACVRTDRLLDRTLVRSRRTLENLLWGGSDGGWICGGRVSG